ncbi:MAG: hypothetical protein BWY31_03862 [Lentisphaerae bacterium ADurb.Bin242]|nr:MAG: hypothetical protein BWY31_03862 [Lentisphaerae bacterium ADurb.Bin242]
MNRLIFSLLPAVYALSLSAQIEFRSGFGHGRNAWGDWKSAGAVARFSHNSTEGATAPGALQIDAGPENPVKASLVFTNHFPAFPGKIYRASVMVSAEGLTESAVVSMTFQGKGARQEFLGTPAIGIREPAKTFADGKWHKLEYTLTVPSDGKWEKTVQVLCCLGVNGTAAGKVLFDDFTFSAGKTPSAPIAAVPLPARSAPVTLVSNGSPKAAIIIPDSPLPCHELAAEELALHVKKASGAELPVFRESARSSGTETCVWLGPCRMTEQAGIRCEALPPSGWLIRGIGKNLFIAGHDRSLHGTAGSNWYADWQGTLSGVYAFLRNEMGVRWLFPGDAGMVVPARKDIVFSGKTSAGKPKLLSAELVPSKWPWIGWSSKDAFEKFTALQARFLLRHGFGSVENMNYSHNFGNYWKRFSKTHPEFFALVNPGNRTQLSGDTNNGIQISLCLSNPGLHSQTVSDWEERPPKTASARPFLSVMLNDTPEMCTCPACRAWDFPDPAFKTSEYWGKGKVLSYRERWQLSKASWGEQGASGSGEPSLSDRYARFCLAVQAEARKSDPDVTLIGYAYTNYTKPPKSVKLNNGIIIQNVFGLWYPYTAEMSRNFRENWNGWNDSGVRQMYRPNLLHAGGNLPVFYGRRFAEDFRWAYRNGLIASYMDSLTGAWSAQNANLYVICRMHENPELTCDEILDEYCACFGKASGEIRRYIDFWEKHGNSITAEQNEKFKQENAMNGWPGGTFQNYALIAHEIAPLSKIAEARKILEAAKIAAADDTAVLARIAYLEKGLRDSELTVKTRLAQIAMTNDPSQTNKNNFNRAFEELKQFRAFCESEAVVNCGAFALRERFGCNWPWKDLRTWNEK